MLVKVETNQEFTDWGRVSIFTGFSEAMVREVAPPAGEDPTNIEKLAKCLRSAHFGRKECNSGNQRNKLSGTYLKVLNVRSMSLGGAYREDQVYASEVCF